MRTGGERHMNQPLPGALAHLAPLLDRYGYLSLAGFVAAEGVGIPTPAVTIVVASAVYAGTGSFNLPAVIAVTVVASVVGDNVGYAVGRFAGKPALVRWGRYVGLTERRMSRAEEFFARRGANIVIIARFIDGLRQTSGLIAGAAGMTWGRYAVRDALGALLWAAVWITVGYSAGQHIDQVYATARRYERVAVLAVAAVPVATVAWHLVRRRRQRRRDPVRSGASER
jgi:membrane protein DedA with SNARE-associated domain